jgi:tetratricopeptide (TPR) repeat protein
MSIRTTEAQTLVEQAQLSLMRRDLPTAKQLLTAALVYEPAHPMALCKLAEVALLEKDHATALVHASAALDSEPFFAPAWSERAHALWLAGRRTEAVEAARQAIEIQPHNARFRLRFAQFAAWTGHIQEARESLTPLLDPAATDAEVYALALGMLGEISVAAGAFPEAMPLLTDALRRLPSSMSARVILGMNRLRLGDFTPGWPDLGIREPGSELYPGGPPARFGPWWDGGDLTGKSILVADDQGHGDAIQFFRFLPMLQALHPERITWRSFPPLTRLFTEAAPDIAVVAGLPDDARFDVHCTSTSLPRWFGTTADTIPADIPYLHAPTRTRLARPVGSGDGRPQVGLVWSGDARHMRDHLRSVPASLFLRLADTPGIDFHSLQHEVREADLPALTARPGIGRAVESASNLADTAGLIDGLDLVIAVDTAIAHLAGAMGKPVWIPLHITPDWRWQTERTDSPWYPTARLFRLTPAAWLDPDRRRQRDPDDEMGWSPLIRRVAQALRTFARQRRR